MPNAEAIVGTSELDELPDAACVSSNESLQDAWRNDSLRTRIRERLATLNKTAREVSRAAGRSPDVLRAILDGRSRSPNLHTLRAIANQLGCTVEWLRGEDDTPPPQTVPPPTDLMLYLRAIADGGRLPTPAQWRRMLDLAGITASFL